MFSRSLRNKAILVICFNLLGSLAVAQTAYPVEGPAGRRPKTPPISPPSTTPPVGNPVIIIPPLTPQTPVPPTARQAFEGQAIRERATALKTPPLVCRGGYVHIAGERYSFESMEGSLHRERSPKLIISGNCLGPRQTIADGLLATVRHSGGAEERLFVRPGGTGISDLAVQTWSPTRIEFLVPPLANPNILPLSPTDELWFHLKTSQGFYAVKLTQADIDKFERDGILTFAPPS
jgi:hypothetical protein